jgi:hypothetical protein
VVVPLEKVAPELCVAAKDEIPQLSEALGSVQVTLADEQVVYELLAGQLEITGSSLSVPKMITSKLQLSIFPKLSTAV